VPTAVCHDFFSELASPSPKMASTPGTKTRSKCIRLKMNSSSKKTYAARRGVRAHSNARVDARKERRGCAQVHETGSHSVSKETGAAPPSTIAGPSRSSEAGRRGKPPCLNTPVMEHQLDGDAKAQDRPRRVHGIRLVRKHRGREPTKQSSLTKMLTQRAHRARRGKIQLPSRSYGNGASRVKLKETK